MDRRRLRKLALLWREEGVVGVGKAIGKYFHWRVKGRKSYILVERFLDKPVEIFPSAIPVTVRPLRREDIEQIKANFFPLMQGGFENDRHYFALWEICPLPNHQCFVAESQGRILHYSWVVTDVARYGDVAIGKGVAQFTAAFTLPEARGSGLFTHVQTYLLRELQLQGFRKALARPHKDNTASIRSNEKAGFSRSTSN